jgi:hypothetical protein
MIKIILQSKLFQAFMATLIIIIATLAIAMTFGGRNPESRISKTTMPWEVELVAGGFSRVFGITLGQSTLGDAIDQLGESVQVAIITPLTSSTETTGSPPQSALEAYIDPMRTQYLSGRLVISVETHPEDLKIWSDRSVRHEKSDTGARLASLSDKDLQSARHAIITGLTYIPGTKLDESIIQTRFGNDGYRQEISADLIEWRFPSKGLVISLNPKGRDLVQYVRTKDFNTMFGVSVSQQPGNTPNK